MIRGTVGISALQMVHFENMRSLSQRDRKSGLPILQTHSARPARIHTERVVRLRKSMPSSVAENGNRKINVDEYVQCRTSQYQQARQVKHKLEYRIVGRSFFSRRSRRHPTPVIRNCKKRNTATITKSIKIVLLSRFTIACRTPTATKQLKPTITNIGNDETNPKYIQ